MLLHIKLVTPLRSNSTLDQESLEISADSLF